MKTTKILLLGAGMVTGPAAARLLENPAVELTVASRTKTKADSLVEGKPRGTALALDVGDESRLAALVRDHDIIISLLPYIHHVRVAKLCLEYGKRMATTSYISSEMEALDGPAREKGLLLLNEIGVDPGIDHMSAMRIIDAVHGAGGKIVSFQSICGGLPAPENNDNPFGYKFSWSPRGVLLASRNSARFLQDGRIVETPSERLFSSHRRDTVAGLGELEVYSNRDSISYIDIYGIQEALTCERGTYRNLGWCDTLSKMVELGFIDDGPLDGVGDGSLREATARILGIEPGEDVHAAAAERAGLDRNDPVMKRLDWLGLFGDDPAGGGATPLDVVCDRMQEKMAYAPGQRDMLLMRHLFVVENADGTGDEITATMIDYGEENGYSSMARTVGLPLAVAVELMVDGKIDAVGAVRPIAPDIYNPVLDTLETLGISLGEERRRLTG